MKIVIAILSKSTKDPLLLEGLDYLKRLRSPLTGDAIFLAPKQPNPKSKELEGQELLKKTVNFYRIALDEHAPSLSSQEFAGLLEMLMHKTSKTAFLIGSADGLCETVKQQADMRLSLSKMTFPHRMAFLMLTEQLYRAGEIMQNTPYHRE